LTRYVVEGEYRRDLRDIKVKHTIKKMDAHVIVAGYGRVGRKVAEDLLGQRKKVVVIERDLSLIETLERKVKFQFIPGNATKDDVLKLAGIEKASAIVTCMPNDADNLYVILAALEHNKSIKVVARASNNEAVSKLKLAGATHVVMPDSIGGSHMATLIATPLVADFLEKISVIGDHEVNIECIECKDLPSEFQNKKIGMLDAKSITGVNIIGIRTKDGNYIINPASEIEIQTGSSIFVLGTEEQIKALNEYLRLH
jgi:voltage-gated potassium channel